MLMSIYIKTYVVLLYQIHSNLFLQTTRINLIITVPRFHKNKCNEILTCLMPLNYWIWVLRQIIQLLPSIGKIHTCVHPFVFRASPGENITYTNFNFVLSIHQLFGSLRLEEILQILAFCFCQTLKPTW